VSDPRDEKPAMTPLVIGLTRPPMMLGIPFNAFIIIVGVTLIAFLVFNTFWSAFIAPISYIALFALCSRDIRILDIIQTSGRMTPRTRNKGFWGTNSYGP
jgi:type IV secretion system protein VirB3